MQTHSINHVKSELSGQYTDSTLLNSYIQVLLQKFNIFNIPPVKA